MSPMRINGEAATFTPGAWIALAALIVSMSLSAVGGIWRAFGAGVSAEHRMTSVEGDVSSLKGDVAELKIEIKEDFTRLDARQQRIEGKLDSLSTRLLNAQ